jgi:hypothetical protein
LTTASCQKARSLCQTSARCTVAAAAGSAELSVAGRVTRATVGSTRSSHAEELRVGLWTGGKIRFFVTTGVIAASGPAWFARAGRGLSPFAGTHAADGTHGESGASGGHDGQGGSGGPGEGSGPRGTEQAGSEAGPGARTKRDETRRGIGDTVVGLRVPLAGGGARLYTIDGDVEVKVPTADRDDGLGSGAWDARAGFAFERRFWAGTGYATTGWNRVGSVPGLALRDNADVTLGFEGEPLLAEVRWSVWAEWRSELIRRDGARMAAGLGLRSAGRFPWRISVSRGFKASDGEYVLVVAFGPAGATATRPDGT